MENVFIRNEQTVVYDIVGQPSYTCMWMFIHSTKIGESKYEKPGKKGNRNETGIFESENIIEALNKSRKTVVGGAELWDRKQNGRQKKSVNKATRVLSEGKLFLAKQMLIQ